ncbi:hypothetical protein PHLCEN_2v2802 [Hermanssonia centrifuga]|uniref:Uncharacterized protein n=1 Tax=Hermanssonia centrifuga TaxID=98765 RepID=A0A2R6RHZ8_9APHY|nr:hypothetical protein PHLCEN_2v2802 [Hermanssonia centrifuga]
MSSAHPAVHCEELDWTDTQDASKCPTMLRFLQKASQDLIIGADIVCQISSSSHLNKANGNIQVYDPSIILPLVHTLRMALEGNGSEFKVALIALAVRNQATLTKFLQTAEEYLVVEKLNHDLANEELFWGMKRPIDMANETNVEIFKLQYRHA